MGIEEQGGGGGGGELVRERDWVISYNPLIANIGAFRVYIPSKNSLKKRLS